jgi:hypothetical protein
VISWFEELIALKFQFVPLNFGCEVTAISTSAGKEAAVRAIGADHFVLSSDAADMKRRGIAATAASAAVAAAAVFGGAQKPGPAPDPSGPRGMDKVNNNP